MERVKCMAGLPLRTPAWCSRHHERCGAIRLFGRVSDPVVTTKFFLHWTWRIFAQLELSNAWLLSGNIKKARTTADRFHESALSTADPHLQALAWELKTRVAIAEGDLASAQGHIQEALAIIDKFEILAAAWQVHGTASRLYTQLKDRKTAETHRERAKACILTIANSFDPDEPLRASFLAAAPVRRILDEKVVTTAARPQESRRGVGI